MSKNLEISFLLDFYGDVLTDKQREVMQQYHNDDLSLSEIADNFSITRQGVRDSIKRGEGTVLDLEEKIGFAKKYTDMHKKLGQIHEIATALSDRYGTGYDADNVIVSAVEKIKQITEEIIE